MADEAYLMRQGIRDQFFMPLDIDKENYFKNDIETPFMMTNINDVINLILDFEKKLKYENSSFFKSNKMFPWIRVTA